MTIQPAIKKTFTACMEQLQEGYVFSVAATVGCTVERKTRDQYGVDVEFKLHRGPGLEELTLYAQLKNTTMTNPDLSKSTFSYKFKNRAHFDQLAKCRETVKAIVIVMTTLPKQAEWTEATNDHLITKRCCYWMNLEGRVSQAKYPTVRIPTANLFDAESLKNLFNRLEAGINL